MKNYLYLMRLSAAMIIGLQINAGVDCQVILSENFSGFTTGSHATPSTSDASSALDSKTIVPGWTGYLVYSAAGEIKIGTSALTGWIETPTLDLSGNGGNFIVAFDICRWPGDASTIQVFLNGIAISTVISPVDNFQNMVIRGTGGTSAGKIKVMALTKRFFIDNLQVISSLPTENKSVKESERMVTIFPVPASDELTISYYTSIRRIEIFDVSGRNVVTKSDDLTGSVRIPVNHLKPGLYIVRLHTSGGMKVVRFVKR